MIVAVWVTWATTAYLVDLPETNRDGQDLLFVWRGHDDDWWRCQALRVALQTSLVLFAWLLFGGIWRLLRGRSRSNALVAAAVIWLCVAAGTLTVGSLATSYLGGSLITVVGPGGMTRVVTQDAFDGDVVQVYRPVGRFGYLRESGYGGRILLDPRRGACSIVPEPGTKKMYLVCGDTSYQLPD